MHDIGHRHEEEVVYYHGDHIPLNVRNASVVAFWLRDVLDVAFEVMPYGTRHNFGIRESLLSLM